jgi:hypothetical protein
MFYLQWFDRVWFVQVNPSARRKLQNVGQKRLLLTMERVVVSMCSVSTNASVDGCVAGR